MTHETREANVWNPTELLELSADTRRIEERLVATADQTLFTLQTFTYALGTGSLAVFVDGAAIAKDTAWTEQTDSSFQLVDALAAGTEVLAVGYVAITGNVDVRDTDIFVSNYQAVRDYAGTEVTVYAQGEVTIGDGGETMWNKITGMAPGFFVDNNSSVLVPTAGDGSIGWVARVFDTDATLVTALQVANFTPNQLGQVIHTAGYSDYNIHAANVYELVAGGTAIADGGSYIDLVTSGYQLRGLFPGGIINAEQFGVAGIDTGADAIAAIHAFRYAAGRVVHFNTSVTLSGNLPPVAPPAILADAVVALDETGIIGSTPVTRWNNSGTGGNQYDLDTPLLTTANLTRQQVNGVDAVHSAGDAKLHSSSGSTPITAPGVMFVVYQLDTVLGSDTILGEKAAEDTWDIQAISSDIKLSDSGSSLTLSGAAADTELRVATGTINGAASSLAVSGIGSVSGAMVDGDNNFGGLFAGLSDVSFLMTGTVAAVYIFEGTLTAQQKLDVQNYLANKYATGAIAPTPPPVPPPFPAVINDARVHYQPSGLVGDPITGWANDGLGGSALDLEALISGAPTTIPKGTLAGYDCAVLDGVTGHAFRSLTSEPAGARLTMFYVLDCQGITGLDQELLSDFSGSGARWSVAMDTANQEWELRLPGLDAAVPYSIGPTVLTVSFDQSTVAKNFIAVTGEATDVGTVLASTSPNILLVGAHVLGSSGYKGKIVEMIGFSTTLTPAEVLEIQEYLEYKYAI